MRKPVVCHVIHSFSHVGGAENGIVNILNNYSERQVLVSLTNLGSVAERVTVKNVKFFALEKRDGNDFSIPFRLFKIFRSEGINVVHLRGWASMLEGFLGAKLARVSKIVYSEHGRHFEDIWAKKKINTAIKKYIFNHVDSLMTVSSDLSNEISRLYQVKRDIHVIKNGVGSKFLEPRNKVELRRKFQWGEKEKIVGTVCRLVQGKGLAQFIDEYLKRDGKYRLVIVGDGPQRRELERAILDHPQGKYINLLGSRDDVSDLLGCFDVFVLSSLSEGLSNVILEAMASCLPIVAFDAGGNKELVVHQKGGILVPIGDFEQMLDSLEMLVHKDELCTEMGEFNHYKINQEFRLDKMIADYQQLYRI